MIFCDPCRSFRANFVITFFFFLFQSSHFQAALHSEMDQRSNLGLPLLSELPPEILLIIARFLPRQPCQVYSATTLHNRDVYVPSLLPLSLVSKTMRNACIAAGLFNRIKPKPSQNCFYRLLRQLPKLSSLTIDISKLRFWNVCANIMRTFAGLDEICLTGIVKRGITTKLCNSALGEAFQQFSGSTLRLKNVLFTVASLPILLKLDRSNITNLYFDQCEFIFKSDVEKLAGKLGFTTPLCPKAKVVSFVFSANPDEYERRTRQPILNFTKLFLERAQNIRHVGLNYGYRPRLLENRETIFEDVDRHDEFAMNMAYHSSRRVVLTALCQYSQDSLVSFTEYEGLSGPFMIWYPQGIWEPFGKPALGPFNKMKLLAFQCRDFNLLYGEEDGEGEERTAGIRWSTLRPLPEGWGGRKISVWIHVIALT